MPDYEIDEVSDVLESLDVCLLALRRRPCAWKWVFIALHNALCGAMVSHLTETDGSGAFHTKTERRYREALEKGRFREVEAGEDTFDEEIGFPSRVAGKDEAVLFDSRLGGPQCLFEKLKKSQRLKEGGHVIVQRQAKAFEWLHQERNERIHFRPQTRLVDLAGVESIVGDVLDVIVMIIDEGWAFRFTNLEEVLRSRIEAIRVSVPGAVDASSEQPGERACGSAAPSSPSGRGR